MPRRNGEHADDWLARAVETYLKIQSERSPTGRDNRATTDERIAALADWWEAAKAVVAENPPAV